MYFQKSDTIRLRLVFSLKKNQRANFVRKTDRCCPKPLLGQSFVFSDSEKCPLQYQYQALSRPHSLPGLYNMGSGMSLEWFRSGIEIAGS